MIEQLRLDHYAVGGTLIVAVVVLSVLIQGQVKKRLGKDTLENFHEVGGIYMSAVGTLYAVLLGLIVVDASSRFNEARESVLTEANSLIEVYAFTEKMPEQNKQTIKKSIQSYVDHILSEGWESMERSEFNVPELHRFRTIMEEVRSIEPVTENQKALYPAMIESFVRASESRRSRLNYDEYDIPTIEWFSLIMGGIVTIAFTMFFAIEHRVAQALMTAMVAFILSLNLYIAFLFNTPYSGDLSVKQDSFILLKKFMEDYP
ncbi:MAG: DUF4239 domain-containing protein [Methylococcaceae bacterium]|nr:DUF4239 domain-containing protein [Methylococcaceae bacterium]